jgi:hypothetical protein
MDHADACYTLTITGRTLDQAMASKSTPKVKSPANQEKLGPSPRKFLVPSLQSEIKLIIEKLIQVGSTHAEATQKIAMRRNVFNRKNRHFKKTSQIPCKFK